MDHAGSLSHPADGHHLLANAALQRDVLGSKVSGHDCSGRLKSSASAELLNQLRHTGFDTSKWQASANDASRPDEDFVCRNIEEGGDQPCRLPSCRHARRAGAGIGVAAVDNDGTTSPPSKREAIEDARGCDDLVTREDTRNRATLLRHHQGQIEEAGLLDSAMNA